ncbi:MAG: peptidoglycan-binding protein [Coriobacteriia bacterium]|nr:peptidoglycan-binding protein [Coriobacteriia bacterium]
MRPIRKGDRGPAVEDVQRRLRVLGADLGPTGIDGVFLGATLAAVRAFQKERDLEEDGDVGERTWAALVDATFRLGDRLLYLHFPHFHGADVLALQGALNVLGFAAGDLDGIFGAFTERAAREFQSNSGLPADGIVGPDTVRSLGNLRHVWADKPAQALDQLHRSPARSADVLSRVEVGVVALDSHAIAIADRLQNLALASNPAARVRIVADGCEPPCSLIFALGVIDSHGAAQDRPRVVAGDGGDALATRLEVALLSSPSTPCTVDVVLAGGAADERAAQRIAVGLLDGLCLGLAAVSAPVLP